jgi:hypothetical protein
MARGISPGQLPFSGGCLFFSPGDIQELFFMAQPPAA